MDFGDGDHSKEVRISRGTTSLSFPLTPSSTPFSFSSSSSCLQQLYKNVDDIAAEARAANDGESKMAAQL